MHKGKYLKKKIIIMQVIMIMALSMILNIFINVKRVEAVSQTKVSGVSAFPESYQTALNDLKSKHPNWTFIAYNTDLTWGEFIQGEVSPINKNTIYSTDSLLLANGSYNTGGGYYCASQAIIEYYADPRNFLTEQGIFQFLEMSYNSGVQTKAGVQNILANTFMSGTVTSTEGTVVSNVKAKQDGSYIIVTPGTKNSEVASVIEKSSYTVKKDGKEVSNSENAGTGYIFCDTTYTSTREYTMVVLGDVNGDGEVKASDYMKIKNYIMGTTTLDNLQKKASDVNGDSEVKASDYMKIKNYIMDNAEISATEEKTNQTSTMTYAEIIMKAAQESGISPYSIAIKIIQEVGTSGSGSTSGTYSGYEGYYNFFNWGASDGNDAIAKGLEYAKAKGWNSPYTSIVEGAKQMADSYVSVGQNTAYFYKFNVISNNIHNLYTHQYMTNIQDPSSQASNLMNTYMKNNMLDASLSFIIPVYKDMPENCYYPSAISSTAEDSYYINGTDVYFRKTPSTSSANYGKFTSGEIVTVITLDAATADGYTWSKVKKSNGIEGYVAKTYLTKCN